jgi:serine/threonine protein kinase
MSTTLDTDSMEESGPGAGDVFADKYELVRRLGGGGMGVVFEARHKLIGRRFAIKVLYPDLARSKKAQARFRREAEAAGRIESEHVVAVVDFGVERGLPFLVMELLHGADLREMLQQETTLDPGRATHLVHQACLGVAAGHALGVIHRDLKPENLFVTRRSDGSERVLVLDFGVAHLEQPEGTQLTSQSGAMIGTLSYMAPEQVRGEPIDRRADTYALGAILYELLGGQAAHPGRQPHAVAYHVLHEAPVRIAELVPALPAELVALVERAMAKDPEQRFQHAEELAAALGPFIDRRPPPREIARTEVLPSRHPSPAQASRLQWAETVSARPPPRSSWLRAAVAIGLLLLAGGAAAIWGFSRAQSNLAVEQSVGSAVPAAEPSVPAPVEAPEASASAPSPPDSSVGEAPSAPPARKPATPPAAGPQPAPRRPGLPLERDNPYR